MLHEENTKQLQSIFQEIHRRSVSEGVVLEKYSKMMDAFFSKRNLPINQYLEQLEKNVPYNKFLFLSTLSELVDYIYKFNKSSDIENDFMNVLSAAQKEAANNTPSVTNYLQSIHNNVSMTDDFKHLKSLKTNEKYEELFDELEFQIQYYKAHYEMICYTALFIISNPPISQFIASKFHKGDAMEALRGFTRQSINHLLTNYSKV